MSEKFSIYNDPFSEETIKLRHNSLLSSTACLFIGLTNSVPNKIALFGLGVQPANESMIGWFILLVSSYVYFHFLSSAIIELADWVKPFWVYINTKKELIINGPFHEDDFENIPAPTDESDRNAMYQDAKEHKIWEFAQRFSFAYKFIYLKLLIEVLVPIIFGGISCIVLFCYVKNL